MKIIYYALLLVFAAANYAYSQDENIDKYFDEGDAANTKNILKINALAIVNGDLPISYERIIGRSFGLEIGAGVLFPYYIPELVGLTDKIIYGESSEVQNPQFGGYSIWVHPKVYYSSIYNAPEGSYIGFLYRQRNYKFKDAADIVHNDWVLMYGTQFMLGEKFTLDYSAGIGFRGSSTGKTEMTIPICIKFGIML